MFLSLWNSTFAFSRLLLMLGPASFSALYRLGSREKNIPNDGICCSLGPGSLLYPSNTSWKTAEVESLYFTGYSKTSTILSLENVSSLPFQNMRRWVLHWTTIRYRRVTYSPAPAIPYSYYPVGKLSVCDKEMGGVIVCSFMSFLSRFWTAIPNHSFVIWSYHS